MTGLLPQHNCCRGQNPKEIIFGGLGQIKVNQIGLTFTLSLRRIRALTFLPDPLGLISTGGRQFMLQWQLRRDHLKLLPKRLNFVFVNGEIRDPF